VAAELGADVAVMFAKEQGKGLAAQLAAKLVLTQTMLLSFFPFFCFCCFG